MAVSSDILNIMSDFESVMQKQNARKLKELDQFTVDIKYVEKVLLDSGANDFGYKWDWEEDIDGVEIPFWTALHWCKERGKISTTFSEDSENYSTLLGENAALRYHCIPHLRPFLEKGIKSNSL